MIRRIAPVLALATVALGGCALRSDVRRLEEQLTTMQDDNDRRDSLRAAQLSQILALQQRTTDSLAVALMSGGAKMGPGAIALTRIWSAASSRARASVSAFTPAFAT